MIKYESKSQFFLTDTLDVDFIFKLLVLGAAEGVLLDANVVALDLFDLGVVGKDACRVDIVFGSGIIFNELAVLLVAKHSGGQADR